MESYKSAFHAFMPKKRADKAVKVSDALIAFRSALEKAGVSKKKANEAVKSVNISKLI